MAGHMASLAGGQGARCAPDPQPDRRGPDLQRQVGAGPGAGRTARRHRHQRRLHAGLSRSCACSPPGRRRRTRRGAARALRRPPRRGARQRRLVARRRAGRDGRRPACRSCAAAPACTCGADAAASPTSPNPAEAAAPRPALLLATEGAAALHARLAAADPATAARLRPSDGQRLARAWEVWRGTGRGLCGLAGGGRRARPLALPHDPARPAPRRRCARPSPPASTPCSRPAPWTEVAALDRWTSTRRSRRMRAHGVPELSARLRGELTLAEAAAAGRGGDGALHEAAGELVPPPRAGDRSQTRI